MANYSTKNFSPYNMNISNGYKNQSINNAPNNSSLVTQPKINLQTPPDTVSFRGSEQVQSKLKKEGSSTGKKIGIGLGVVALIGLAVEVIWGKGRHLKTFWEKIAGKGTKTVKPPSSNSTPTVTDFKNIDEAKEYFESMGIKTVFKDGSEKHLIDLNHIKDNLPILEKNGVAIAKPNSIIISDWRNVEEAKQIFRKFNINELKADTNVQVADWAWGTVVKGTDDKCHVLINSSHVGNCGKFIHEMGHIHQDSFKTSFWHSKGLSDREFIDKQLKVFGLSDIGICDDGVDLILREAGNKYIPSLFRNIHFDRLGQEAKTKVKNMFPDIVNEDDYLKLFSLYGKDRKNYVINAKKMVDKMYSESGVYAPAKTWENVAEIFEGLNKGKEYSDLVMLMYDINGGGRVPNLVIKGMKYDDYIESLYNNKDLIRKLRECIEVKELI